MPKNSKVLFHTLILPQKRSPVDCFSQSSGLLLSSAVLLQPLFLCRKCFGNILHRHAFSGFLTVIVLPCKARLFQVPNKLVVNLYLLLAVLIRSRDLVHINAVNELTQKRCCKPAWFYFATRLFFLPRMIAAAIPAKAKSITTM